MKNLSKEEKKYIVYGLFCPLSKVIRYIGITCQAAEKRLRAHMSCKESENQYKYRWIQKLKKSGLKPTIIILGQDLPRHEACNKEIELIAKHKKSIGEKLTNLHEGGNIPPSWTGKTHTPEMCKEISKRVSGKNHPMYGIKGSKNPRSIPVCQYDKDGNLIKKFVSIEFAKNKTGIDHISDVCNGNLLSAGGYIWRFAQDSFDKYDDKNPYLVYQFTKEGKFIAKYFDCKHAKDKTGIDASSISSVCLGKTIRKSAGGFLWRYKDRVKDYKIIETTNNMRKE